MKRLVLILYGTHNLQYKKILKEKMFEEINVESIKQMNKVCERGREQFDRVDIE